MQDQKECDEENDNTLCWETIFYEMNNIRPAFEIWAEYISDFPPGYQKIICHMIFDVKMGKNFRRKAQFFADGNKTNTPMEMTYSSVVSRDLVSIVLMISAINDLDVLACDIDNAYIMADCREQVWVVARPKF